MALSTTDKNGNELKNAANIQKALDAKEERAKLQKENSDFQRRINYRVYNESGNHSVRNKNVRKFVTSYFRMSASEQKETLLLIEELSK